MSREPKVYLLPNLMTAGNLFCGFMAVLTIFRGMQLAYNLDAAAAHHHYQMAILLIFGACLFDVLDGRLARMGGRESPFGREFDSLADIVSFGIAPALLVFEVVLMDLPDRIGWLIAFMYLLCGAMRLARFNCLSAMADARDPADEVEEASTDFSGFPIPAAAGVISSLTLFMIWMDEGSKHLSDWKFTLAGLMIFLSLMMVSRLAYPSFKKLGWRTRATLPKLLVVMLLAIFTVYNYQWMPALLFVIYLLYGFVRPFLSRSMRKSIEEEVAAAD